MYMIFCVVFISIFKYSFFRAILSLQQNWEENAEISRKTPAPTNA